MGEKRMTPLERVRLVKIIAVLNQLGGDVADYTARSQLGKAERILESVLLDSYGNSYAGDRIMQKGGELCQK